MSFATTALILISFLTLLALFGLAIIRIIRKVSAQWAPGNNRIPSPTGRPDVAARDLASTLEHIYDQCSECGACVRECAFLSAHGTPKAIIQAHDFSRPEDQTMAYACSLCGLCAAVCPEQLDPCTLFLAVRRRHVQEGHFQPSRHRRMIAYEQRGISPLFSWHGLPEGCDTVFFPGCTLPGTRPEVTLRMYRQLQTTIPSLGLVLDCCLKASHDLGMTARFQAHFHDLRERLVHRGVHTVLTACPNCTKIFRLHGQRLRVRTVYEVLHAQKTGPAASPVIRGEVSVHDPCPLRDDLQTQGAIRGLLADMGCTVVEMNHHGRRTVCCGEGGSAGVATPDFAERWANIRLQEAGQRTLVAACAGCASRLNRVTPTVHIVDLMYGPKMAPDGRVRTARPPLTYWNRLRLKGKLRRMHMEAVRRAERSAR